MGAEEAGLYAIHVLFAGLWTGTVVFVTFGILPAAREGTLNAEPLAAITSRLRLVSRASAVVLPLTGIRLAMVVPYQYTDTAVLFETTRGHLLLGMIVLWLILMGLVEVGASKLSDGTDQKKVREPARNARPFLLGGSVVAVLLLIDAGLLLGWPL